VRRERTAWNRAAPALDEILYLALIFTLLEKVLRWVDRDGRKLRDKLTHVLVVIL